MKRTGIGVAIAALVALLGQGAAEIEACVGKSIQLGRMPGREQEVLAEIFSLMVGERTGTTVVVKAVAGDRAAHEALQKADLDLYLEDQGVALREILGLPATGGAAETREVLRREYEQRFNLVWLEPWGMTARPSQASAPAAALIAPVIRKDTLKKFPALSRLVNKLAGQVDDAAMARLVRESEGRPAREVVKRFLKDKKLI